MPKIDPLQLLNCLKILLSENGGIGSSKDVTRVAGLMNKYSKKLVSKCIYIQILKCTNTDLLEMFMSASGWDLVYNWLVDAITKNNWILVQEVLELFLLCPVDTTRLKSNSAPKVVKNLSIGGGTSVVKHLATKLVDQWLYIVKSQTPSAAQVMKSQESTPTHEPAQENPPPIKILLKDGKQVVAKIEKQSSVTEDRSNSPSIDSEKDEVDEASTKEKKDPSDKEKSSSSSSKSSSSSSKSRHKSSSSSSSSKKSSSSSSSSSSRHSKDKSSSSSSSSKSSDSKDKDRHRSSSSSKSSSRDKDREKDRHRSKDKSSSFSSSSKDKELSKDKEYSKDKESNKDKDKIKDKDTSSSNKSDKMLNDRSSERDKIIEKLAKITKKSKEDEDSPTSITVPSKKASISIEIKKDTEKSSAVKTYKSQFRSHGLTEEAPPPPSRKGLKKPITQTALIPPPVQPTTLSLKRASPPPKEIPTEKRAKIDIITSSPTSIPEKVGGVKLIAPKPKPTLLVETNIFSDALSAAMVPKKDIRKRKLKTKDSPAEPDSPQKVAAPLKFYQDTLDEKKEDSAKAEFSSPKTEESSKDDTDDEDDIPLKKVKEDIKKKEEEAKESTPPASPTQKAEEEELQEIDEIVVKPPGPGCGPNGPPGVLSIHRRRGPKKKLTWRPEAELEQIRYFESDENERVNVTKTSFMDMKQLERCSERDAMSIGKKFNPNDNMLEQTAWIKPYEIDGEIPVHPMGSGSKEKLVQQEREKNTLKTIYFSVGMIPDAPAEADFEHYVPSEPISIPIDDVTGNPDTVNDFTGMAWPDAKIGVGDDMMSSSINENPFKPINPFTSTTFLPFPHNESNWMNHGPPPMGMPPMNMNGPPMNMNGPPMRPPNFFNGNPNQFGPPPPNFGPGPGPNMNMNVSPNNFVGPPPNFINGPPRDFGNSNRRVGNERRDDRVGGSWRGGNNSSSNNSSDNWRNGPPAGPGDNRGPRSNSNNSRGPPQNWVQGGNNNMNKSSSGNGRVCKAFLRGNCRHNRCNFIHPKMF